METLTPRELRAWLEREIALGLDVVPRAAARAARQAAAEPVAASAALRESGAGRTGSTRPVVVADRPALPDPLVEPAVAAASSLENLREVLGDCQRCKLCKGRSNIVFGVGDPSARLMFVGEGPGEDEDLKGEPFVGAAGALLDRIITGGMGLRRGEVYIANVVKCRPPNNRNPEPDEIVACEPFLRRQVDLVRPEVLVSLGNFATQVLLGDRTGISKRRGRWHEFRGIALMPTFHPAYLLRNPSDKRLVWEDIQLVMQRLGLPVPARGGGA
ncbi:MAG: uracil-DNA glycosylase family protein [Candidatus Binatia bacterium]